MITLKEYLCAPAMVFILFTAISPLFPLIADFFNWDSSVDILKRQRYSWLIFTVGVLLTFGTQVRNDNRLETQNLLFETEREFFEYELIEEYSSKDYDFLINEKTQEYTVSEKPFTSTEKEYDLLEEKSLDELNYSNVLGDEVILRVYKGILPEKWRNINYPEPIKLVVYK